MAHWVRLQGAEGKVGLERRPIASAVCADSHCCSSSTRSTGRATTADARPGTARIPLIATRLQLWAAYCHATTTGHADTFDANVTSATYSAAATTAAAKTKDVSSASQTSNTFRHTQSTICQGGLQPTSTSLPKLLRGAKYSA